MRNISSVLYPTLFTVPKTTISDGKMSIAATPTSFTV